MSITEKLIIRCDHPHCDAEVEIVGISRMDLQERHLPDGWWMRASWRKPAACPAHAARARKLEHAMHEWNKREVAARNKWSRANPPPKLPKWLDGLQFVD